MSKEISKKNLAILAGITGIDESVLSKIHRLQILDIPASNKILVKEEYRNYTKDNSLRKGDIFKLLSGKYRISRSLVEQIIYNKNTNKQVCCINCGEGISRYKYKKNGGNCDKCKTL
jgi:hypothetical protein